MHEQADAGLAGRTFDLLVVGGGINGAAIARDAAARGLSVALVEMHDWGWGTSAKSSKLAHGGLRYLEQMEFGLVHEALRERGYLLEQAGHLVHPLRFLYPLYPHTKARHTVRLGLWFYDQLARRHRLPRHHFVRRDEALELAPSLTPEGLHGAAVFFDAQIVHVERLVLEMALQARDHGAVVRNHTRVDHLTFERAQGRTRITGAVVEDEGGQPVHVAARCVVNATGCWVDEVLGPLAAGRPAKVRTTKGVHVVVPRFLDSAVMVRARDGRTFFVLPWMQHCILGTTDTDYEGDAGAAVAEVPDVRYLVDEARRYFPGGPWDDIDFAYAGVRALVNQPGVSESNVTRRHVLYDHAQREGVDGLWTIQGGKITTARSLAEDCVDHVAAALGRRRAARQHPTRTLSYPGSPGQIWPAFRAFAIEGAQRRGLGAATAAHLVDHYGGLWEEVLRSDERPEAWKPLVAGHLWLACEVTHAVSREQAAHLGDVALRRTDIGLAADGNPVVARAALAWMGDLLGWDGPRRDAEWRRYEAEARQFAVPREVPAIPAVQVR